MHTAQDSPQNLSFLASLPKKIEKQVEYIWLYQSRGIVRLFAEVPYHLSRVCHGVRTRGVCHECVSDIVKDNIESVCSSAHKSSPLWRSVPN